MRGETEVAAVTGSAGDDGILVVGLGSSAGGIEALKGFFQTMDPVDGMAFVIVQHLDPTHESLMDELMARQTRMDVLQVEDGMEVKSHHVYVIPPNTSMTLRQGRLRLREPEQRRGMRTPIDTFFRSLADARGEKAVGIVLSGTASDGTEGLKEIKAHGGLAIAQDPDEAQHDGMPTSAIRSNAVDYVLPVAEMGDILNRYARHPWVTKDEGDAAAGVEEVSGLDAVLAVLRVQLGPDFRGYRKSTLLRRVQRRMGVCGVTDLGEYRDYLRENPEEARALLQDLLIGVTAFFREPAAWDNLASEVIAPLMRGHEGPDPIRVWVPGCSMGKEAYSLAMLLMEERENLESPPSLQIFATDIDQKALEVAREGLYPEQIAEEIPAARLQRFFARQGGAYRVRQELRDMMTFAIQNLISDPPFSHMDLISCRNLLIYLEPDIQARVIELFHFALNPGGHLFLGTSESVTRRGELFEPVSQKWRIYRKVGTSRVGRIDLPLLEDPHRRRPPAPDAERPPQSAKETSPGRLMEQALVRRFVPAAVLIDACGNVLYFHGDTERFLTMPEGEPTRDLLSLVREGLRTRLRAAIAKAAREGEEVEVGAHALGRNGAQKTVIRVLPLAQDGLLAVSFTAEGEPVEEPPTPEGVDEGMVRELEEELKSTREELQSTIEEMETSNEELKASNEEVMSMNEELQSTNEELETSKEELQSLNEELTTVNAQLQSKVEELEVTNNDLDNLITSTEIATLFLDTEFRLKRFTPAVTKLMNLIPTDVGRPIGDITSRVPAVDLVEDVRTVLDELRTVSREIHGPGEDWYVRRCRPYRTQRGTVEGVVVTFTDVSELKRAQIAARERAAELETLMGLAPVAVWIAHESEASEITGNAASYRVLGLEPPESVSKCGPDLKLRSEYKFRRHGRLLEPEELPLQRAARGEDVADLELELERDDGHRVVLFGNACPIRDEDGEPRGAVAAFLDITDRKRAEEDLERLNAELESLVEHRTRRVQDQSRQLQSLAWQLADAEQQERRRLSQFLHDHLQQLLVGAKYRVRAARGRGGGRELAESLDGVDELIDQAVQATRDLTVELSPPVLFETGLAAAVQWLAKRMNEQGTIVVDVYDDMGEATLKPHRRVLLFECIRELLINAARHSGSDRAEVRMTFETNGVLKVQVEDEGAGFELEKFERAGANDHFGLFNLRQRLESIGGEVDIDTAPGEGTRVTMSCPPEPEEVDAPPADQSPDAIDTNGLEVVRSADGAIRILIVDDHRIVREGLREILEGEQDLEVVGEAADGAEGVEMARRLRPQVVLMDINMPGTGGVEATRLINSELPDVRIVGLSIHEDDAVISRMTEAGACAFFNKGAATPEVIDAIRAQCSERNR
jgi:two-component system CheB/CheR fusion protein